MKKRLQSYFLALMAFLVIPFSVNAQVCMPDSQYTASGIYPDTLPNTCVNEPYSQTVTLVIPEDTVIGFPVDIDSVVLQDVIGLPPGLSYLCEPTNCSFAGGTNSCVLVSGTPTVPGTYEIDIATVYHVSSFVGPVAVPDTQEAYYTIVVSDAPSLSVSTTGASCAQTDGSATVTATGMGPFTYAWSDGQTTATASNLGAGVYAVDVTDANGCTTSESVTVPSLDLTIVQDSVDWAGCAEDMGGSVYVSVTGGTGTYTYSWDNGATTEDLTGVSAATYVLTATDGNNCVASEQFTIAAPDVLTITEDSTTNLLCYGNASGAIYMTVNGGVRGYTYSWDTNPMQTTDDATGLSGGTYTLMVTDELGCVKTLSSTISEPDSFFITFADTAETAAGAEDGRVVATASGGTAPYTYSWDTGDSTAVLDSIAAGTYTLTITDANGCELVDSVEVQQWTVGLEDELAAGISRMEVYPNPSNGIFSLNIALVSPQKISVGIYDMKGKRVYSRDWQKSLNHENKIMLNDLSKGMYLLKVNTEAGTAVRRIVLF